MVMTFEVAETLHSIPSRCHMSIQGQGENFSFEHGRLMTGAPQLESAPCHTKDNETEQYVETLCTRHGGLYHSLCIQVTSRTQTSPPTNTYPNIHPAPLNLLILHS
jgi:hypothetical protein